MENNIKIAKELLKLAREIVSEDSIKLYDINEESSVTGSLRVGAEAVIENPWLVNKKTFVDSVREWFGNVFSNFKGTQNEKRNEFADKCSSLQDKIREYGVEMVKSIKRKLEKNFDIYKEESRNGLIELRARPKQQGNDGRRSYPDGKSVVEQNGHRNGETSSGQDAANENTCIVILTIYNPLVVKNDGKSAVLDGYDKKCITTKINGMKNDKRIEDTNTFNSPFKCIEYVEKKAL